MVRVLAIGYASWVVFCVSILAAPTAAAAADADPLRPYPHPDWDIQFSATYGWQHVPRPGDEQTHERVDPETGIHVLMWVTSTEQDGEHYLDKMVHMMDVADDAAPRPRRIAGRSAWIVEADATIGGTAARTLLAVIPAGRSDRYPAEELFAVVQIWCPREDAPRLTERMADVLASVRLTDRVVVAGTEYRLYPATDAAVAGLPSPLVTDDGESYLTVTTRDGRYGLVRTTVRNGAPNAYDRNEWGPGRQLAVDAADFPSLARDGLHKEAELARTTTITGRPVATITAEAKPGQASRSGFVAADEELVAVIRSDNRRVARLGLTHPELARPLFELFNVILRDLAVYRRGSGGIGDIASVRYNGHDLNFRASGGKGWQESIFADEVLGYYQIQIERPLTAAEKDYLRGHYGDLAPERYAELLQTLTTLTTGEMVPFYIQRYGFYEGHVPYRADPLVVARLFGLVGLVEIDAAADGDLWGALTRHNRADDAGE